ARVRRQPVRNRVIEEILLPGAGREALFSPLAPTRSASGFSRSYCRVVRGVLRLRIAILFTLDKAHLSLRLQDRPRDITQACDSCQPHLRENFASREAVAVQVLMNDLAVTHDYPRFAVE